MKNVDNVTTNRKVLLVIFVFYRIDKKNTKTGYFMIKRYEAKHKNLAFIRDFVSVDLIKLFLANLLLKKIENQENFGKKIDCKLSLCEFVSQSVSLTMITSQAGRQTLAIIIIIKIYTSNSEPPHFVV